MMKELDFDSYTDKKASRNKCKQFKERIKQSIFNLLMFLLKYSPLTNQVEVILVLIQMFQLAGYAFDEKFRLIWKNDKAFDLFKVLFCYFKILPFFRGDTELYLLFFYSIIIIIFTILFFLLILAIRLPKTKIGCPSSIRMLSIAIPILSTILFIPIFETLFSIFICTNGYNLYGKEFKCWTNEYIVHCIMSGITLTLYVLYSFLIQNTYFELKYNNNGYSSKKTLLTDNILLYNKMIITIGIKLVYTSNASAFIIAFIVICMAYLAYCYTAIPLYYYYEVQKCYILMAYISTWTFCILFVSQLTIDTKFSGNIVIYVIGSLIICLGIVLSDKRVNYSLLLTSPLHISSGDEAISKIDDLFSIIYSKENDRRAPVLLFGYVNQYSSNSIKENDPLKKYIEGNDRTNLMYLIVHIHSLYLTALGKFPDDVRLRIFYAIFVFDCLSKREQALMQLDIALSFNPKLSFEFIIYRLKDVFENKICNGNTNTFSSEMSELATTLIYKTLYREFKIVINKTANQYIIFWNILSNSNQSNQEDLSNLNAIGFKIKNNLDKINKLYSKMIKIKPYNQEILLDYFYFNSYILNDEDNHKVLGNQLKELSHSNSSIDESNLCHLDLNKLSTVNDYYYVIFSAMPKDIGIITHISIPVCSLFGYTKKELIGYPVEKLLPELYFNGHKNSLLKIIESYKKKMFDDMNTYHNFRINFINTDTYAINKSKYLMPLHYKGAFIPNDDGNNYFFMKIIVDSSSLSLSYSQHICYVLTDKQLVIQHFSANSTCLLGLNSEILHSSKEITTHIKQLNEDYINYFIHDYDNKEYYSEETKIELKCKLVKSKYTVYSPITWINTTKVNKSEGNYNYNNSQKVTNGEDYYKGQIISPTASSFRKTKMMNFEDNFMLIVTDYGDFGEKEGFIFKLEPIWQFHLKENNTLNTLSNKDVIRSLKSKKILYGDEDPFTLMNRLKAGSRESSHSNPQQMKFTKGFIPEINQKFEYNPNTNSYYQAEQDKPNGYHTQIKEQAETKCNQIKYNQDLSSSTVSSFSKESEAYSSSSYVSNSDDFTHSSQDQVIVQMEQSLPKYDYYHVDISKIKYSVYDYSKKVVTEKADYSKISEVEFKMFKEKTEEKQKEPNPVNQNNTKATTPITCSESKGTKTKIGTNKEMIKKEIRKAFKKSNVQHTILILYILSLATFILGIIKESIFLFHYLTFIDTIQNYVTLIRFSYKINRNVLHSIYSLRELLLTNFDSYEMPFEEYTKEEYIKLHLGNLEMFFKDNDEVLTKIMKNPIQIQADKMTALDITAGYTFFIQTHNNYSVGNNTNTFRSACFALNYALEHIIHTPPNKLYPSNEDVFMFMFTTINSLWTGLLEQNEIYKTFFSALIDKLNYQQIILFFVLESLMFIAYITSRVGLKRVSDQNDSYLSVYFSINKEIIINSLAKCETFVYQFQTNTIKEKFHDELSENKDDVNYQITEDNNATSNHSQINATANDKIPSLPKNLCNRFKCLSQFFLGYMIIILGTITVFLFDGIVLGYLFEVESKIMYSIKFYEGEGSIEKDTVLIFDLLRESIFDKNAVYLLNPLKDSIGTLITNVYNSIQKEKKKAEDYIQFLPSLYDHYYSINYKSICKDVKEPDKCIKNSSKSALYGLETLIMYFIEEIRFLHYTDINLKIMNTKFNFTYNYTLYGTSDFEKYFPTNPGLLHLYHLVGPMNLFNSDPHKQLSYIYWYLLYPKFQFLVSTIGASIEQDCLSAKQFYIVALSSFMAFIIGLLLFIWFPYVHKLNLLVYQTKNMLSIIPIDILVSVSNINTLLNINKDIEQLSKENIISSERK